MAEYRLIQASEQEHFEELMTSAINEGFKPLGLLFVCESKDKTPYAKASRDYGSDEHMYDYFQGVVREDGSERK